MGTPERTVTEAIEMFGSIGLKGAEIVVQDGYHSGIPYDVDEAELQRIKDTAEKAGVEIVCLTPYYSRYNSLDDSIRQETIEGLKKVIDYAHFLGAKRIRIYGGEFLAGEIDENGEKFRRLVAAMRECGDYAAQYDICLVIENHFNTMCVTAAQLAAALKEIDHLNVGALYDQPNLIFMGGESYDKAIPTLNGFIRHVHAKDLVFKQQEVKFAASCVSHPTDDERNVISKVVGEGITPWPQILKMLSDSGYDGWLSLEYERRWYPEQLPDAAIGMKKSAEYLRSASPKG